MLQTYNSTTVFNTESVGSPLAVAIWEHRTAEGELSEVLPNGASRIYWVKAEQFFDAGRLIRVFAAGASASGS
jgi:hypothetical protein